MALKQFCLWCLILCFPELLCAQNITNFNFEPAGKTIQIRYDLSGKTTDLYEVAVFYSQNEGKWEGPLQFVSGDVGKNVRPGIGKRIVWEVLKEKEKLSGNLRIKLEISTTGGCRPLTVTHTAGSVAPVTKTVTYGVVETNLTGSKKCWITQNLGADRQARYATDASEASSGWYWQFNRKQGYNHDGTTRTPNSNWITSINENSDWLPANDPCALLLGSGWRLPTFAEWEKTYAIGGWDNLDETFNSVLKLHAAGFLFHSDGSLSYRGSDGLYWSSSQYVSDFGWYLDFGSSCSYVGSYYKGNGHSVRCLRD